MPPRVQTNLPKKTVRFGESCQWIYSAHSSRVSAHPTDTKETDGPDEYTKFKGTVYAGYLQNHYTSAETMIALYGRDKMYTECHRLYQDLCEIVGHLRERPTYATDSRGIRITRRDLPRLTQLLSILCMMSLDSRLQNILRA